MSRALIVAQRFSSCALDDDHFFSFIPKKIMQHCEGFPIVLEAIKEIRLPIWEQSEWPKFTLSGS